MRITSKGQVTIPLSVREAAGLMPGSEVDFVMEAGEVKIRRALQPKRPSAAEQAVARFVGSADTKVQETNAYMDLIRGGWGDEPAGVLDPDVSDRR